MEGCVGMCCHLGGSAVVLRRVGRCWPTWFRFLVDMCEKEVRLEAPKVHTAASGLALECSAAKITGLFFGTFCSKNVIVSLSSPKKAFLSFPRGGPSKLAYLGREAR